MECLFIKKIMYSKYFQLHILQDISHAFVHLLRNKLLELFIKFCFLTFSGERRIASLNKNVSCVLSWFLCSV